MDRRWSIAIVLVTTVMVAGCTADLDEEVLDGVDDEDLKAVFSLSAESPESEAVTVLENEGISFEVVCEIDAEEGTDQVTLMWTHLDPTGGERQYQSLPSPGEKSTWHVEFEDDGEHVIQTQCHALGVESNTVSWTVQVEPGEATEDEAFDEAPEGGNEEDADADEAREQEEDAEDEGIEEDAEQNQARPEDLDADLTMTVVDVGQGDGIVLQRANWTVVFDTGDRWESRHGPLLDHLDQTGVETVEALVISHPHADHAGGCDAIIENLNVNVLIHPGVEYDTQTWADCLDAAENHGVPTLTGHDFEPGDSWEFIPGVTKTVLHVDPTATDVHVANIALKATFEDFHTILTGDLECNEEELVIDRGFDLDTDVLSLGHHGSSTSTCDAWLQATTPSIATAGVGEDNQYGHPHDEVVNRLYDHGVDLYQTDVHGTITVTSDGSTWDVTTQTGASPTQAPADDEEEESDDDPPEEPEGEELVVTATVSDPEPCQYTDVTVTITVEDETGNPVEGASTVSTWNYKSSNPQEEGTTDEDGVDEHTRGISRASEGYEVVIDVQVELGDAVGEAQTSFTPQSC